MADEALYLLVLFVVPFLLHLCFGLAKRLVLTLGSSLGGKVAAQTLSQESVSLVKTEHYMG